MAIGSGLFRHDLETDPITGCAISRQCWNQHHQVTVGDVVDPRCDEVGCECLCHQRTE